MKKLLLLILFSLPHLLPAQLIINELMTNNVSALMDDSYNYSMWVELYNPSSTTSYNQTVYYFTDDLTQPRKWCPASKLISPGGYSVLWFERSGRTGHANFKLEPKGSTLYLLNAFGQIIDRVDYPEQYRNISYGRKKDGGSEWGYFNQHSAGKTNNGKISASQRCAKPEFNTTGFITP
ncbi:MAG: spore coat protein CotH [Bacteroidetes bacterium]|nr:spore coat protein CotH [Bacteroidota bacterium]